MIFPASITEIPSFLRTKAMAMTSPPCGISSCLYCGRTGSWTMPPPASGRTRLERKMYSPRPGRYGTPYDNNQLRDTLSSPQISITLPQGKGPANGGANALAAPGGESVASIAF